MVQASRLHDSTDIEEVRARRPHQQHRWRRQSSLSGGLAFGFSASSGPVGPLASSAAVVVTCTSRCGKGISIPASLRARRMAKRSSLSMRGNPLRSPRRGAGSRASCRRSPEMALRLRVVEDLRMVVSGVGRAAAQPFPDRFRSRPRPGSRSASGRASSSS